MEINENILLKDLDWYENSICKIEYVKFEVSELKIKERLNVYDQIKINTLLYALSSSLEYAAGQFYKKRNFGSNIPNRNENSDDVSYRKKIEKFFEQRIDEELFNIFNDLIQNPYYKELKKMNNDEKHNFINLKHKIMTQTTETLYKSNENIYNYSESEHEHVINMYPTTHPTTEKYYNEAFTFTMNNREVFQFLNDLILMVEKFVEDIKDFLSKNQ
ncbi:TPA: hypothetical protein ACRU8R_002749 [Staphylococcus aureus]